MESRMSLYKNKYRNESARLPGYDYSTPGYYFLTVCTHDRGHLFGEIDNGKMNLNEYGIIVRDEWDKSFAIRRELVRDEFVVMPNHFHGIVQIVVVDVGTHGRASLRRRRRNAESPLQFGVAYRAPKSVSSFMGGVKSAITKRINQTRNTPGARTLQYRFHDHIIRNENELFRIRQYIRNNPINWELDKINSRNDNSVMEMSVPYGEEPWMI